MIKEVVEVEKEIKIKEVIERDFYKNQLIKLMADATSEQLKELHTHYISENKLPTAEELVETERFKKEKTERFKKEKENQDG